MEGYPALAEVMSTNNGLDIFRRFCALNVQNLLYMQAELSDLELDLKDIAAEDQYADPAKPFNQGRRNYSTSARALRESAHGGDGLQWKKMLEIRKVLQEYNTSLLQYTSLRKLRHANKNDLNHLREWLRRPKHGNDFLSRAAEDDPYLLEAHETDLVACSARHDDDDGITRFTADHVVPWIAERLYTPSGLTNKPDVIFHPKSRLECAINIGVSVLSSLLPTLSIFGLYYTKNLPLRLGMIVLFTTIFAVVLAVVVRARRVEIFAAATA